MTKNVKQIKKKLDAVETELAIEESPLFFIYGLAQARALRWVLEEKE